MAADKCVFNPRQTMQLIELVKISIAMLDSSQTRFGKLDIANCKYISFCLKQSTASHRFNGFVFIITLFNNNTVQ